LCGGIFPNWVGSRLSKLIINDMQPEDWQAVRKIYLEGIATGNATFETEAPEWEAWDSKHLAICRLIAREANQVFGWAALVPYSSRSAYAGVAEVSIYIAKAARGLGVGTALLNTLISESEAAGFWTLQAGIFEENTASRILHRNCGFREVGYRERIGQLHGVWRNVILLERRSSTP
jgi:L-amino acid N-acyltransferase YncA